MSSVSGDSGFDDGLIDYVGYLYLLQFCQVSATAVLLYDIILTWRIEVEVVWRHKPGLMAILHIFNRYIQVIGYALALLSFVPRSNQSCHLIAGFQAVFTFLPYFSWAVFSAFRAHALSNHSVPVAILVFLLSAMYVVPDLYLDRNSKFVSGPPLSRCMQNVNDDTAYHVVLHLIWVAQGSMIFADSIVLVLTLRKLYRGHPNLRLGCQCDGISEVLFTNGLVCFIVPMLLNLTTLALRTKYMQTTLGPVGQCVAVFRDALTTNLISRFLLDLGMLRHREHEMDNSEWGGVLTSHFSSALSNVTFILPDV
ncbi:hypothetical protein C8Q74DRAFT_1275610, partial [Fomes fomentarius]